MRLDSGDMVHLSLQVRRILDAAGLQDVKIFASSGFDEYKIADTVAGGAEIDAFGVGTNVGGSADAPYVDIVYKLVRYNDRDVRKLSPGKTTLAGEKQVFRVSDSRGRFTRDFIGLRRETVENGIPQLETVMQNGRRCIPDSELADIRKRFQDGFTRLPARFRTLDAAAIYPVQLTPRLEKLQAKLAV